MTIKKCFFLLVFLFNWNLVCAEEILVIPERQLSLIEAIDKCTALYSFANYTGYIVEQSEDGRRRYKLHFSYMPSDFAPNRREFVLSLLADKQGQVIQIDPGIVKKPFFSPYDERVIRQRLTHELENVSQKLKDWVSTK